VSVKRCTICENGAADSLAARQIADSSSRLKTRSRVAAGAGRETPVQGLAGTNPLSNAQAKNFRSSQRVVCRARRSCMHGRIAARTIEQLVAHAPMTMRQLIDETPPCRAFRS
jgi:hypothetical protein